LDVEALSCGIKHANAFGYDLFAYAITGDDRYSVHVYDLLMIKFNASP